MDEIRQMPAHDNGSAPPSQALSLEAILNEITARLVLPQAAPSGMGTSAAKDLMRMMIFRLGSLSFGLDILHISEVLRAPAVTRVPRLPAWVLGVANFHGEIISIVHLPSFLGMDSPVPTSDLTVLVTHASGQRIGLVVDEVSTIYTADADELVSPAFRIDPGVVPYLRGAVEREDGFIRVLHGERLLLAPHMQQFS